MSKGTVPITGTITTTSDLDTYPTHWDKFAKGGHRSVADTVQRDAITSERRTEGMQVYVRDIKQLYQLVGGIDNTKWVKLLTITAENKVEVNNDLNLQKYIIEGVATPLLPNAVPLAAKADGYLVNKSGAVNTTTTLDPSGITLSKGKLLIGSVDNKAIETQEVNINNLPTTLVGKLDASFVINSKPADPTLLFPNAQYLSDLANGGMIKFDYTNSKLNLATPDVDYATKATLEALAAAAQKSADAAASSSSTAGDKATIATAAAGTATTMAGLADTYAKSAGESAIEAGAAVTLAGAAASLAGDHANAASGYADTAKAASGVALDSRDKAAVSATSAATSLKTLQDTGLNAFNTTGNIDIKTFRIINAGNAVNANDLVTLNQVTAISGSYVKSVSGTALRVSSSGGQNPVIDLVNTGVTAGTYTNMTSTVGADGRISSASSVATINTISTQIASNGGMSLLLVGSNAEINMAKMVGSPGSYDILGKTTIDSWGRVSAASNITFSGVAARTSVTGSGTNAITIDLVNTGVTAGTYTNMTSTVGADGRIYSASSVATINTITTDSISKGGLALTIIGSEANINLAKMSGSPGSYDILGKATVDSWGRVSAASNVTFSGTTGRISLTGSGTSALTLDIDTAYVGQTSITKVGAITTGVWNGSAIPLANGGTNAALTAANGGIVYSTSSALAILAATATANQLLVSGANAAPSWTSRFLDYGITDVNKKWNLFVGTSSGSNAMVTGKSNTSFGIEALTNISPSSVVNDNTAIGFRSLYNLTNGTDNVALGSNAGAFLTNGIQCTLLGAQTSVSSGSRTNASAVGYGIQLTQDSTVILGNGCSVGIGTTNPKSALSVGDPSAAPTRPSLVNLFSSTTNMARIILTGQEFLTTGVTSTDGIAINLGLNRSGFRAITITDSTHATNSTNPALRFAIQSGGALIESVNTDQSAYKAMILNSAGIYSNVNNVYTPAGGAWLASSDSRVKKNIKKCDRGLKEIIKLNVVNFEFNEDSGFEEEVKSKINTGLIADEVEKVMPECIGKIPNKKFGETRSLDSTPIIYAMITAIKELNEKIERLEANNK